MKKAFITTIVLVLWSLTLTAQCPVPQEFIKLPKDKLGYSISTQSKSGNIKGKEVYEVVFVSQNGLDYRINILGRNPEVQVTYEIYEMVNTKYTVDGNTRYKKTKKVLFSSTDAEKVIEFASEGTHKLYIRVSLTAGTDKDLECVGILIEQKFSEKVGF